MNVAFGHESVLPDHDDAASYLADLARRLIADGHEVHLYACRHDEAALPPELHGHVLPPVRGPRFLRPWRFGARCRAALAGQAHDVTVGFDGVWGLDVLYPHDGLYTAAAEQRLHRHANPVAHGLARLRQVFRLTHWSERWLERRQYLGAHPPQIIVSSEMVRDHFASQLRISPDGIKVIPRAIDPARFPQHDRLRLRQEGRQAWQLAPADIVGLCVGGATELLPAVAALLLRPEFRGSPPPLRLLIADSDRRGERLAAQLGLMPHVRFTGPLPDSRTAYFAADLLVHPSFYDPCSLVVLEALACDLPVIASRSDGASELMHPLQEGFVIDDPHDHAHLAWCLAQMLDPARRRSCAQAARRTAALWTFEHHYQLVVEALQEVIQRKQAA
jgi:UDP-glucose:(heptosyl)LPS alpha-1,3-glucosyltransferase